MTSTGRRGLVDRTRAALRPDAHRAGDPDGLHPADVVFLLMRVAPGDPISAALGGRLSPGGARQAPARAPASTSRSSSSTSSTSATSCTLDFGTTLTDNRTVTSIIVENGGATVELTFAAFMVALVVGHPAGPDRGPLPRHGPATSAAGCSAIIIYAAPVFFLGFLVADLIAPAARVADLRTTPARSSYFERPDRAHPHLSDRHAARAATGAAFWDVLEHLILPAVTLGLLVSGVFIRLVRVNLLQTMQGDYVEAARARGISERRVVVHHAFRNAMVPVITVDRPAVRDAARRRRAHRADVQLARASARSSSATSTTATTSPSRGSSPSSRSRWSSSRPADRHRQRPDRPAGEVLMRTPAPALADSADRRDAAASARTWML